MSLPEERETILTCLPPPGPPLLLATLVTPFSSTVIQGFLLRNFYTCTITYICDMIKGNESDVANVDFEL